MRLKGMLTAAGVFVAAMSVAAAPVNNANIRPGAIQAAAPAPASPPSAEDNYHALLAKMCAVKHLEWLSEGELDDLIEVNFHDGLPATLQTRLDAANAREKAACANTTGGLACFNQAYVRAMDEVKLLPRFVRTVCDSGLTCQEKAECGRK